jgi:predicted AlkP superfamily pyrophosphatase or phosphodiesterase
MGSSATTPPPSASSTCRTSTTTCNATAPLGPAAPGTPKPPVSLDPPPADGGLNPAIRRDLYLIDSIVGDLLDFYEERGVQVVILSEYGIVNVDTPVHLNRRLRAKGWLVVKDELGLELLDPGASRAFAVADHQVAHIYVADPTLLDQVRAVVAAEPGVAEVLGAREKRERGIDHPRAGDLIAVARENAWFTYYYWEEDRRAPDFARCVDIHRKPGYDPVELFTDPRRSAFATKAKIGWRLLQKSLGFRMLMDLIPLDATLVRGSHGARPADRADWPLLIGPHGGTPTRDLKSTEVRDALIGWITAAD